ncbi:MAG: transcriptional repressor [Clostridia bacterium]|nr:transcriptional repressor [Clostridia bacterium]
MRHSAQRDTILRIVKDAHDHPTADTIYSRVREEIPNISLGTVYRNLKSLSDMGEVDTMETLDKSIHYDGNTVTHRHFICRECSHIIDLFFECKIPEEFHSLGLLVESQKTIYYGLCPDCQRQKAQ